MIARAKAPLRLGLAGGGTDVSPYCDEYGGYVLNASINMYAHTSVELLTKKDRERVVFEASDFDLSVKWSRDSTNAQQSLPLHVATYKRICSDFLNGENIPVYVRTHCDAPAGSGLGSSSTLVVSMIQAYKEALSLPLGEYDVAKLAYEIERIDCGFKGGKQDQYAATFGGFNFMEFYGNRVIVNPLRIRRHIINELESWMLLFYTGQSRSSAKIIEDQSRAHNKDSASLEAMHQLKESASKMKELLLQGNIDGIASAVRDGWIAKKNTAKSISNANIEKIEADLVEAGISALKISGAGGGGYMMVFVDPKNRRHIEQRLSRFAGFLRPFQFSDEGSISWKLR